MARVGIREVAAVAGVSMGTVSHYLNHPDRVSQQKAEQIRNAIERLGFVRNNAGRQLRLGRSTTIAYIAPDVSNPFFASLAEGVERRAAEAGLSVFLANSQGERAREDSYLSLFQEYGVLGLLVGSPLPIEERLAAIRAKGTPTVLVGRRAVEPQQPSISTDDVRGGFLAAKHLLDVGRRRIAYIGGPLSVQQVADRLQGASQAVRAHGSATLEVLDVDHRVITTGHEIGSILADRSSAERPDAVFAVNDLIAIGLVQTLTIRGIAVPDEVAVIGYDDIEYAENAIVPLSSVRSTHEDFGVAAMELLLGEIESSATEHDLHRVFEPEVVVRASTGTNGMRTSRRRRRA